MSACSALVSWYSSTRTWSKRPLGEPGVGRAERAPAEQQVVEVEEGLRPLALEIGEQRGADAVGLAR